MEQSTGIGRGMIGKGMGKVFLKFLCQTFLCLSALSIGLPTGHLEATKCLFLYSRGSGAGSFVTGVTGMLRLARKRDVTIS
jgi:hypothetical protein